MYRYIPTDIETNCVDYLFSCPPNLKEISMPKHCLIFSHIRQSRLTSASMEIIIFHFNSIVFSVPNKTLQYNDIPVASYNCGFCETPSSSYSRHSATHNSNNLHRRKNNILSIPIYSQIFISILICALFYSIDQQTAVQGHHLIKHPDNNCILATTI